MLMNLKNFIFKKKRNYKAYCNININNLLNEEKLNQKNKNKLIKYKREFN